jgi:hypothetical protein
MLRAKLIAVLLSLRALVIPCECDKAKPKPDIEKAGRLSELLTEASGLVATDSGLWMIRDSGAPPVLYLINQKGELLGTDTLAAKNQDWEALAADTLGNLYIGDIGNNSLNRQNLKIYRYRPADKSLAVIEFSYPKDSVANQEFQTYDSEAMVWAGGKLHLFTKGWKAKVFRHFSVPDSPGRHVASFEGSIPMKALITDASVNREGNRLALLSYGKVYTWSTTNNYKWFSKEGVCIEIPWAGQCEAIGYTAGQQLLIANETGKVLAVALNN